MKQHFFYRILSALLFSLLFFHCAAGETPRSDETSLVLISQDRGVPPASQNRQLFYKIYVNEELTAQTGSALPGTEKSATLHLRPGKYWIYAERWTLSAGAPGSEESPGQYQRANNVWQMKTHVEVVIVENRRQMVRFGFDHTSRRFYWQQE